MENIKNEIALNSSPALDIKRELSNTDAMFTSLVDDGTRTSKAKIYNAISNPKHSLADFIGKQLEITDVVCHYVEMVDDNTGEVIQAPRVVFVDVNGETYQCISNGVLQSIKRIFPVVGMPSWKDEPLKLVVGQKKGRKGFKFLTLELVE